MKYQIFYTDSAKQDLKNIYRYISDSLVEPEIAEKLTDKIMKSIRSLDEMPQRYRLFDEEPWRSRDWDLSQNPCKPQTCITRNQ